jgi:hypothetical protein
MPPIALLMLIGHQRQPEEPAPDGRPRDGDVDATDSGVGEFAVTVQVRLRFTTVPSASSVRRRRWPRSKGTDCSILSSASVVAIDWFR